jgi:hypothetical protein
MLLERWYCAATIASILRPLNLINRKRKYEVVKVTSPSCGTVPIDCARCLPMLKCCSTLMTNPESQPILACPPLPLRVNFLLDQACRHGGSTTYPFPRIFMNPFPRIFMKNFKLQLILGVTNFASDRVRVETGVLQSGTPIPSIGDVRRKHPRRMRQPCDTVLRAP